MKVRCRQRAGIATKVGSVPKRLLTNMAAYVGEEARFLAAIEKGIAAAKRGEVVAEEEIDACLKAMLKA